MDYVACAVGGLFVGFVVGGVLAQVIYTKKIQKLEELLAEKGTFLE